jgi:hypothetical protein
MSKALKLGDKTKVIPIKPKRSRNRLRSPYEFSLEAVTRAADTLVTFGFSEAQAYRTIAAQLHESLVKLKGGAK